MHEHLQAQLTATKQRHILGAAARVFAAQGFHASTVKDVAREAGVAHGSIYNAFENKHALLIGLFELMAAQAVEETAPPPPGTDPRALLTEMLRRPLAALTRGDAELFRVVVAEVLVNRELAERFRIRVLEPMIAVSAGVLRGATAPAHPDLLVRALSGLVLGLILQRLVGDPLLEERWDDLPDLLAGLLLDGLNGGAA